VPAELIVAKPDRVDRGSRTRPAVGLLPGWPEALRSGGWYLIPSRRCGRRVGGLDGRARGWSHRARLDLGFAGSAAARATPGDARSTRDFSHPRADLERTHAAPAADASSRCPRSRTRLACAGACPGRRHPTPGRLQRATFHCAVSCSRWIDSEALLQDPALQRGCAAPCRGQRHGSRRSRRICRLLGSGAPDTGVP
jgi:hypothetical protein